MWLDLGDYHGPASTRAFLSYATARTRERNVTRAYREYVTESLRLAPSGRVLSKSLYDMLRPHEEIDVEATVEKVARMLEEG